MSRSFKRIFALFTALVSVTCIASNPGTVNIGNSGEPGSLDPHLYFTNLEEHILKDLFLGLTTMDSHGNVVPGSATHWEVSDDGLTWTFYLRDNLLWSDGATLSSEDFVFSFKRLVNPETAAPLSFFVYSIKNAQAINSGSKKIDELGVYAVDPKTLVIELENPFPFLPERLLYPIAYPVPKHVIQKHSNEWIKAENWVSNGAFILNEWRPQEYVSLRKNNRFYDEENVLVNEVRYHPITDAATSLNRYLANELDVIGNYPKGVHQALLSERSDEVRNAPLQSIMYLVFNTTQKPFDDVRVRKALALAIDKELITEKILAMGEIVSSSLSPPIVDHYVPVEYEHEQNLELAREIMHNAGFDQNTLEVELRHISDDETNNVYIAIASMWREIGVSTTLHHTTIGDHFGNLNQGNFEVAQAGWFGENNPEHYIELLWSKISSANYGKYSSPDFDRLFELAKTTGDLPARIDLLNQAETVALKDYAVIPLYVVNTRNLVRRTLKGWDSNGRNLHPARFFYWE